MRHFILLLLTISNISVFCNEPLLFNEDLQYSQVEFVKLTESRNGSWTFDVTVRHDDSGWEHYADLWVVINPKTEKILGSRTLAHPHVGEQPFTRSLSGIIIDKNIRYLEVRSKCTIHGYKGQKVLIDLTLTDGDFFKIKKFTSNN